MKRPSILSESLHQRLNSYALAASAAGVGVLALAQPAEAKIVYTPANVVIDGQYALDLDHDGVTDFSFHSAATQGRSSAWAYLDGYGAVSGNRVWCRGSDDAALRKGIRIGPKGAFGVRCYRMVGAATGTNGSYGADGPWAGGGKGVKNRYLGLKFVDVKGETHYGWARLDVQVSFHPPVITATLTGYAYETIPNKPIIAGKTHGPDVVTVQDPSLGHLARGAAAIPAWRRTQH